MNTDHKPACGVSARALMERAEAWAQSAGGTLHFRHGYRPVDMVTCQSPLLAAAIEIFDMVSQAPGAEQLLRDLGFEPVTQNIESK